MRFYLDYNIYNNIQKDNILNSLSESNHRFYLSVNHIEEFYKAYVRDNGGSNHKKLNELQCIMTTLSPNGILNPGMGTRIINKSETFEDCLQRIKSNNTQEYIRHSGYEELQYQKEEAKKNSENSLECKHSSNCSPEEIWQLPVVQEKIKDFRWETKNEVFQRLTKVYGCKIAIRQAEKHKIPKFTLHSNMYREIQDNYQWLEYVIEYLDDILCECCYNRDRDVRTAESGIYDVAHIIYATYCEYFVTDDKRLSKRASAIYSYLGVMTKTIPYKELKDLVLPKNSELSSLR